MLLCIAACLALRNFCRRRSRLHGDNFVTNFPLLIYPHPLYSPLHLSLCYHPPSLISISRPAYYIRRCIYTESIGLYTSICGMCYFWRCSLYDNESSASILAFTVYSSAVGTTHKFSRYTVSLPKSDLPFISSVSRCKDNNLEGSSTIAHDSQLHGGRKSATTLLKRRKLKRHTYTYLEPLIHFSALCAEYISCFKAHIWTVLQTSKQKMAIQIRYAWSDLLINQGKCWVC